DETVTDFLLDCTQYVHEQHILMNALRCQANSISFLLNSDQALDHLMHYINSTGRFKPSFGEI
ncbi:hypothetical protein BDR06DRAFT_846091, partial [Suillus hirtellus]